MSALEKNARVWFRKEGSAVYISHLDLNRVMLRAIQKSKLPIWYTEGFNPHPFITFSLPLSLGFTGTCESMDLKFIEEISYKDAIINLNDCLPEGIVVYGIDEPIMKPKRITYAKFIITLLADDYKSEDIKKMFLELLEQNEILVDKKTKKGIKKIDIKPEIINILVEDNKENVQVSITLPAGSQKNINPMLYLKAFEEKHGIEIFSRVTRTDLYNEDWEPFA